MFGRGEIENVPAASWAEWVQATGGVVVDVREPAEWRAGTLPGAELIAMSAFDAARLDPAVPVLVVCRSGNRSLAVARALKKAGFSRVGNLVGGMVALGKA